MDRDTFVITLSEADLHSTMRGYYFQLCDLGCLCLDVMFEKSTAVTKDILATRMHGSGPITPNRLFRYHLLGLEAETLIRSLFYTRCGVVMIPRMVDILIYLMQGPLCENALRTV